ncbi:MAG: PhnD/SsuA/transferrin family substrate-binding protein, partial [Nitrospirota bacterium]|nr:PhnD/SsuA/transferrin family substrate-binding protein [Nitrospirota bacterium]
MKPRTITPSLLCRAVLIVTLLVTGYAAQAGPGEVRIGVLAYRGHEQALRMWSETARFLSRRIPGSAFTIVPLYFQEIGPAVGRGDVAFVIANTSIYVELEARYGASRIATLKNKRNSHAYTEFGGVIFCRADRKDLQQLSDLDGRTFMAVEETSLGGWHAAWREFRAAGIDPYRDLRQLTFGNTHDAVVYAVREGTVDAGTVRTDTLERMHEDGLIDRTQFRILNQQQAENFPYALSTRLYPEWPIAKIRSTPQELAQQVVIALFRMRPDDPAAKAARISGWTIPLNYEPVHDLMRELHIGPYQDYGRITLAGAVRMYWRWLLAAALLLVAAIATAAYVTRLNQKLQASRLKLQKARDGLEETVAARTAELRKANEELEGEIAERIRAEEEKERLRQQLLQTQKMEAIGILAGGVAHDFNNILSAIVGYASLLSTKMQPNDPLRHNTMQILAAAERAGSLTRSLLAFSRKQVIEPKPDDLNGIIRGFQRILSRIIGEDVAVSLACHRDPLIVEADKGQIELLLMNLATNARDAMPKGGALRIATAFEAVNTERGEIPPGSYAVLSVADSGVGIEKERQEHIFEPFYTTKEVGKGSGLGLAIAYGIVKKHNGFIHLYSEPGLGTTFRIYLPLTAASPRRAAEADAGIPARGSETILLVEDEEIVRTVTRTMLEDHGYSVIEAVDGENAVQVFRENQDRIQLVLCDLVMPRMNGKEAA